MKLLLNLLTLFLACFIKYSIQYYELPTQQTLTIDDTGNTSQDISAFLQKKPYSSYVMLSCTVKGTFQFWQFVAGTYINIIYNQNSYDNLGDESCLCILQIDASDKIYSCGEGGFYEWNLSNPTISTVPTTITTGVISGSITLLTRIENTDLMIYTNQDGYLEWMNFNTNTVIGGYQYLANGSQILSFIFPKDATNPKTIIIGGMDKKVFIIDDYSNQVSPKQQLSANFQTNIRSICQLDNYRDLILIVENNSPGDETWIIDYKTNTVIEKVGMFTSNGQVCSVVTNTNIIAPGAIDTRVFKYSYTIGQTGQLSQVGFGLIDNNNFVRDQSYLENTGQIAYTQMDNLKKIYIQNICQSTYIFNRYGDPSKNINEQGSYCIPQADCINKNTILQICLDCPIPEELFYIDLGECSICPVQCDTCDSSAYCATCVSDPNRNNPPPGCECDTGYLQNGSQCDKCHDSCSGCVDTTGNCTACDIALNRILDSNNCICEDGYFENQTSKLCEPCGRQCETCVYDSTNCQVCKLQSLRIIEPDCECPDGKYDNNMNSLCLDCDDSCETCSGGSNTQCLSCDINLRRQFNENTNECECIDNYYAIVGNKYCSELCDESCKRCDSNKKCEVCQETRVFNGLDEQKCKCNDAVQHYPNDWSQFCFTDDYAPFKATFFDNLLGINIHFEGPLEFQTNLDNFNFSEDIQSEDIDNIDPLQYSELFCIFLFQQQTLDLLGIKPLCKISNTGIGFNYNSVQIQLGQYPTIMIQGSILFNQKSIKREGAPNNGFSEYPTPKLVLSGNEQPPYVIVSYPTSSISLCEKMMISISEINNDGKRGLYDVKWSLDQANSDDFSNSHLQFLNKRLNKMSDLKSQSLVFEPLELVKYSKYTFILSVKNFLSDFIPQPIEINTDGNSGISVDILQLKPFQFYTWQLNLFQGEFQYTICDPENDTVNVLEQEWNVYWQEIDQNGNILDKLQDQKGLKQSKSQLYLEQYKYIPNNTYIIELKVEDPVNPSKVFSNIFKNFTIIPSDLTTYIEGGDRMSGYTQPLQLKGIAYDMDEDEFQDQIPLTWKCKNMNKNDVCYDVQKNLIPMTQNVDTQEFAEKLFEPYNSFQFTILASANGKNKENSVSIIIIELTIPYLEVIIPQQLTQIGVNLNDNIQIEINYDKNVDDSFFNLIVIFNFDIIGTKGYNFSKFKFKLWDITSDFDQNISNQFLLKLSLYDPDFFMPAQSSFALSLNYPPKEGQIVISSEEDSQDRHSIQTMINIQCLNFVDENQPLQYRFVYYRSLKEYQEDIQMGSSPVNGIRNYLTDFQNSNQINTILPSFTQLSDDGENVQQGVFIMASVQNSLGAITNSTKQVPVQQQSSVEQILKAIQLNMVKSYTDLQKESQIYAILTQQIQNIELYQQQNINEDLQKQIVDIKKQIYFKLIAIEPQILNKVLKNQVIKSIQQILEKGEFDLSSSQIDQDFDKIESIIAEQETQIDSIVQYINQGDTQITKLNVETQDILGKSLSYIDKVLKNIQIQQQTSKQNEELNIQDINKKMIRVQSLQIKITKTLQKTILPNENPIKYTGQKSTVLMQKGTNKYVYKAIGFNQYNSVSISQQEDDEQVKKFNLNESEDDINVVYELQQKSYNENILNKEETFFYKNQNNQLHDLQIIKMGGKSKEVKLQNSVGFSFSEIIKQNTDGSKKNLVCIQKQQSEDKKKKWSADTCLPEENEDEEDGYICKCSDLRPTTLVNDLENVFTNSNLDESFSSEGFKAFLEFQFWKSFIFYIFLLQTSLYLYFSFKGYKLDKKQKIEYRLRIMDLNSPKNTDDQAQQNKVYPQDLNSNRNLKQKSHTNTQNSDQDLEKNENKLKDISMQDEKLSIVILQNNQNVENEDLEQNKQNSSTQLKSLDVFTPNNNNNRSNQNFDVQGIYMKKKRNSKKNKIQKQFSQKFPIQSKDNIVNKDVENIQNKSQKEIKSQESLKNDEQNNNSQIHQKKENSSGNNSDRKFNSDQQTIVQLEESQVKEKQKSKKQQNNIDIEDCKPQELYQSIIKIHELFHIFFFYDAKVSRPVRFLFYYLKIIMVMTITCILAKKTTILQNILVGVVTGILSGFVLLINKAFLIPSYKIINIIGICFTLSALLLCYYLSTTNAALIGMEQANVWAGEYVVSFLIDVCVSQPLLIYFKVSLINTVIQQKGKSVLKPFSKILLNSQPYIQMFFQGDHMMIPKQQ